jgi:hypothetical protein
MKKIALVAMFAGLILKSPTTKCVLIYKGLSSFPALPLKSI